MSTGTLETPSGKTAGDENFPVASFLLPARTRPHVAAFYAFARAIDDIADDPRLAPEDKVARLEAFEAAVLDRGSDDPALAKAHRLRASLAATGVEPRHCRDLVSAFKQDATKRRYRDWDELMDYCDRSAAPVGRYLLDLHGESARCYPASDALCRALQVINHLQDCGDDYRALDRVYLPLAWLDEAGVAVAELAAGRTGPGLRAVLDRTLDGVDRLIAEARPLPAQIGHRRLAMDAGAIVGIAERLVRALRRRDPLAERVELSRGAFLVCCLTGVWRGLRPRVPPGADGPRRSKRRSRKLKNR